MITYGPLTRPVEAQIQGEGVALTDTKIKLSKLTASPQRIGVAIPVTRQTIIQTEGHHRNDCEESNASVSSHVAEQDLVLYHQGYRGYYVSRPIRGEGC